MTLPSAPWRRSALWLLFLGPFFFASYGLTNQLAANAGVADSVVFAWESRIPFIPWTIFPYWSIDLMYGLCFLACADAREVDRLGVRLLSVQVVSVTCFALFPLRFAFDRPEVQGASGWLFDSLAQFDKPYNQAPSLHIALLVIIWTRLATGRRGLALLLIHAWAALVAVSVLTTWQHHFIDLPTGVLAGALCLWLWPDRSSSPLRQWKISADPVRRALAIRYAGGAAACSLVAASGGAALWLLWPAVALAIVALAYLALGAQAFQKTRGRIPVGARLLLAPWLVAVGINSRLWTRRRPDPDPIADEVWLGRLPCPHDMRRGRFDALVDLTAELPGPRGHWHYDSFPCLDLVAPDARQLLDAAARIESARHCGRVLVCCALGYSRSAAAVAAWLLMTGRAANADDAIRMVRERRPGVVFGPAHRKALNEAACVLDDARES